MLRPLREMPLTVEGKTSDSGIRVGAILEQNNGPQHYPVLVCIAAAPDVRDKRQAPNEQHARQQGTGAFVATRRHEGE